VVELWLIKYGLLAVFAASMVEADAVPVLAGVAAHRSYFQPVLGIIAASAGAFAGDCFWLLLGRHAVIQRSKLFLRMKQKAEILFQHVGSWQIPASHVVYGTRVATMIFMGGRGLPFARFALVDGLSCFILTTILFSLGFGLSVSASVILVNVRRIEITLLATVIACGLLIVLLEKLRSRMLGAVTQD
jgi:membrane protein DedA with SNARE-associated domain